MGVRLIERRGSGSLIVTRAGDTKNKTGVMFINKKSKRDIKVTCPTSLADLRTVEDEIRQLGRARTCRINASKRAKTSAT